MNSKVLATTALMVAIMCSQANAVDPSMPIMLLGDWCFDSVQGTATNYKLPSWTDGGVCEKILSITPWSYRAEGWHCEPIKVQESKDCAPSGCHYDSIIIARCQPDGPISDGKRKQYTFSRYKGNLYMTAK